MPSTPDHGLRYPSPDEKPNGPVQLRDLALDIETALTALLADSGVVTTLHVTPADDWELLNNQSRTVGKTMEVHLRFGYNGATSITANGPSEDPGNVPDTTMGTIDDVTKRPVMQAFAHYRCSVTGGSANVNVDGRVRLADAHTSSTIDPGDSVNVVAKYPIP